MHQRMTAATSALLILGLASATPAPATPSICATAQSDDTMEAAGRFSINLLAGWFNVTNKSLLSIAPVGALLSVSPPVDINSSDTQFAVRADDFENWLGDDWQP